MYKKYSHILKKVKLFEGLSEKETETALEYLSEKNIKYKKGDTIINAGEPVKNIGLVLSGSIQILKDDFNGSRSIIAQFYPSEIFAEALVCAQAEKSPVTAAAAADCEIAFIPFHNITDYSPLTKKFQSKIISNMLNILAEKNIFLNNKIEHLSKRSIREKLLSYLKEESRKHNSKEFSIPFNRYELADFLFLDRSAMSRELGKMQNDDLIEFNKNRFKLRRLIQKKNKFCSK